jgi:hypothetical protein
MNKKYAKAFPLLGAALLMTPDSISANCIDDYVSCSDNNTTFFNYCTDAVDNNPEITNEQQRADYYAA